jgi:hypothetical protein
MVAFLVSSIEGLISSDGTTNNLRSVPICFG